MNKVCKIFLILLIVIFTISSYFFIKKLVENNVGLCFANEAFFREEIVNGYVKKVKVIEELFDDNIYIVYKKGKNITNINKFIKILKKQYEEELQ